MLALHPPSTPTSAPPPALPTETTASLWGLPAPSVRVAVGVGIALGVAGILVALLLPVWQSHPFGVFPWYRHALAHPSVQATATALPLSWVGVQGLYAVLAHTQLPVAFVGLGQALVLLAAMAVTLRQLQTVLPALEKQGLPLTLAIFSTYLATQSSLFAYQPSDSLLLIVCGVISLACLLHHTQATASPLLVTRPALAVAVLLPMSFGASLAVLGFEGGLGLLLLAGWGLLAFHQQNPRFTLAGWRWKSYLYQHRYALAGAGVASVLYLLGCWLTQHQLPMLSLLPPTLPVGMATWPMAKAPWVMLSLLLLPCVALFPWTLPCLSSYWDAWMGVQRGGAWFQSVWVDASEQRLFSCLATLGGLGWFAWAGITAYTQATPVLCSSLMALQALILGSTFARLDQQQHPSRFHRWMWDATALSLVGLGLAMVWITFVHLPSHLPFQTLPAPLTNALFALGLNTERFMPYVESFPLFKLVALAGSLAMIAVGMSLLLLRNLPFSMSRLTFSLAGLTLAFHVGTWLFWLPMIAPRLPTPPDVAVVQHAYASQQPLMIIGETALRWAQYQATLPTFTVWKQLPPSQELHAWLQTHGASSSSSLFLMDEASYYQLPSQHVLRQHSKVVQRLRWWGWQTPAVWQVALQQANLTSITPWFCPQPELRKLIWVQVLHQLKT